MAATTVAISRPQRWDVPFGPDLTDADIDRVLSLSPFSSIDASRFSAATPLREIIRNDCRIDRYEPGDLIVREGDYGSSVFFIMSGMVRVALDSLPASVLGRAEVRPRGWFGALSQLWSNHGTPEYRDVRRYRGSADPSGPGQAQRGEGAAVRVFLQDVPRVMAEHGTARLEAGELFGELAALTRSRRTATIFAETPCEMLEMRWQGFRDIRRKADELREHVDRLYRERSLKAHLQSTPIFEHLTDAELQEIADQTTFETYGDFDWYASYQKLAADDDPARRLAHEPIIVEEGSYPNGLIMVRSGFVRVSMKVGSGERTMSYLGRGKTYGLQEIAHNHSRSPAMPLQRTLRAVGYVDVLRVPTRMIERFVLGSARNLEKTISLTQVHEIPPIQAGRRVRSSMIEFLVENRIINGSAAMIIDMDRCTRCDDCVRACAAGHDNNPRFIRHGLQFDHYMVANACMHCADPVCMIGCPTGAIHRNAQGGQVVINDDTCIGCATCANSCPYHNIRMVEIRDQQGEFVRDQASGAPIMKATKCDLCVDQLGGPACQRACPHDALKRVDMADLSSLEQWLTR